KLPGEIVPFLVEHEIDSLPNVLSHGDARLRIEELELLVLLGRDVDGRGDLLPRHGDMTMHDHRSTVKDGGGFGDRRLASRLDESAVPPYRSSHAHVQDACPSRGFGCPRRLWVQPQALRD